MMRSLYSGVAGLQNHQIRMDVIGNNIVLRKIELISRISCTSKFQVQQDQMKKLVVSIQKKLALVC